MYVPPPRIRISYVAVWRGPRPGRPTRTRSAPPRRSRARPRPSGSGTDGGARPRRPPVDQELPEQDPEGAVGGDDRATVVPVRGRRGAEATDPPDHVLDRVVQSDLEIGDRELAERGELPLVDPREVRRLVRPVPAPSGPAANRGVTVTRWPSVCRTVHRGVAGTVADTSEAVPTRSITRPDDARSAGASRSVVAIRDRVRSSTSLHEPTTDLRREMNSASTRTYPLNGGVRHAALRVRTCWDSL